MSSVQLRTISPYKFELHGNLPPGVDLPEQLEDSPRLPRPPPPLTRPTPPLPPLNERRGKWLDSYFDKLEPSVDYDQIVRTAVFFGASEFGVSLSYAAVFCILTQLPSGATAIHGGKVTNRPHQRFYETLLINLNWMHYGSSSPETIKYTDKVNRLHQGVWKRYPGTVSAPWEAQMSVIANVYFETWVRKTVGSKKQLPHRHVREALPEYGERVTSHLVTEPTDGTRSMGINFVRNWDELERFFYWYDDVAYEEQSTPEQKERARDTSQAMVHQFSDLWFPRPFHWIGRQILLVFIPPGCLRRQGLGKANPIFTTIIKLFMKLYLDLSDAYGSDPVHPPLGILQEQLIQTDLREVDQNIQRKRDLQDNVLLGMAVIAAVIAAAVPHFI